MNTKIIKIKCRLENNLNCCFKVMIYHNNSNIFNGFTDLFGCIYFNAEINCVYKIFVNNCASNKCFAVLIDNTTSEIILNNSFSSNKHHSIVINLTDQNYKDLPINKGKVIIWKMKK